MTVLSKPAPSLFRSLKPHLIPALFTLSFVLTFYRRRQRFLSRLRRSESQRSFRDLNQLKLSANGKRNTLKKSFLDDLLFMLQRAIGKRESMNLVLLTTALLGRTYMTLWIADSMGNSMKAFCNKNWRKLIFGISSFASWSLIAAFINGLLKFLQSVLAQNVRQRLTDLSHELYFQRMNYYKVNKVGTDKLEATDQLITDDIDKFSDELADVYSNVLKPVVDFAMFSLDLYKSMGAQGPLGMYGWFGLSAYISTMILPPYGRLFAQEQVLEGRFRTAHADLIANSEMVAFFRGEIPERKVLDKAYLRIRNHVLSVLEMKLPSDIVQGYVNKYLASVFGFLLIFRPVYLNTNGMGAMQAADIAKYFVSCRQVMEGLATSVLAMFELQKKVGTLSGLCSRLRTLFTGLERRAPLLQREMEMFRTSNPPRFLSGDSLRFEKVSVYRPDGKLLIADLNMEVRPGDRVMITGDNGCGKSSLFRVLCGLWPLVCGTITKPPPKDIYFLSQVNFVPIGTLRELVIYPHTPSQMREEGKSDQDILQCLKWAHLEDLKCDGVTPTLDDQLEWGTALSPGQKQRMAFARLLYHRPRYAVLDECTNGISPDVEESLYNRCRTLGMAVFSISHKLELKKLHDRELNILADDKGGYRLLTISTSS